jgi:acyl-CoA synthetase
VRPLAQVIDAHAREQPDALAFVEGPRRLSWRDYAERSQRLAGRLVAEALEPGERLAVLLPDGPGAHVAYVAAERAGLVVVGIGPRAGLAEVRHLLERTGASALLAPARHRGADLAELCDGLRAEGRSVRHLVAGHDLEDDDPLLDGPWKDPAGRSLSVDDVFLLNSTSGTTGLPKCVVHDQARWNRFHELAVEAGDLSGSDVFLSALPTPFGFGLWTAHFTPTLLGARTVLLRSFDADELVRALDEHGVTVLAAVSTQFILMLHSPELEARKLPQLRALFTGGEAVPYERAREFEDRTGAPVLQFYGSNETGALSRTTLRDPQEVRLRSAGHVIESMQVRLFDDAGHDVTEKGEGQPGCRGPLLSRGYYADDAANAGLYTRDGWMLTGDVVTLDPDGRLTVVGRSADFIIRGGKNVSAAAVEEAVSSHPAIALAAAVAMPDPVFGERVCVYAELHPDGSLDLAALIRHLEERGESKESFPERLVVQDALPRSSGGKVAKQALREDIRRRLAAEGTP